MQKKQRPRYLLTVICFSRGFTQPFPYILPYSKSEFFHGLSVGLDKYKFNLIFYASRVSRKEGDQGERLW